MSGLIKFFFLLVCYASLCNGDRKKEVSGEFNSFSPNEKPYRMQRLNLVWEKASKKLSKDKLKSLYTDLKFQDKEEIAFKKLKTEGLDKKEVKARLIQTSFNAILEKYGLVHDFRAMEQAHRYSAESNEDYDTNAQFKHVFRDKKLNKLWLKAEKQGFSEEQLNALKEEFQHHQNKIDQYYEVMEIVDKASWDKDDPKNNIEHLLNTEEGKKAWKEVSNPHQVLKSKHSELKQGYDHLTSQVLKKDRAEFEEPQVQSLWELTKNASFTSDELDSLREELHHFEHRVKKLKFLTEQELGGESVDNLVEGELAKRQLKLKNYNHKVEKTKKEIVNRIMARHTEL